MAHLLLSFIFIIRPLEAFFIPVTGVLTSLTHEEVVHLKLLHAVVEPASDRVHCDFFSRKHRVEAEVSHTYVKAMLSEHLSVWCVVTSTYVTLLAQHVDDTGFVFVQNACSSMYLFLQTATVSNEACHVSRVNAQLCQPFHLVHSGTEQDSAASLVQTFINYRLVDTTYHVARHVVTVALAALEQRERTEQDSAFYQREHSDALQIVFVVHERVEKRHTVIQHRIINVRQVELVRVQSQHFVKLVVERRVNSQLEHAEHRCHAFNFRTRECVQHARQPVLLTCEHLVAGEQLQAGCDGVAQGRACIHHHVLLVLLYLDFATRPVAVVELRISQLNKLRVDGDVTFGRSHNSWFFHNTP